MSRSPVTTALLAGGAVGPPLFVLVFLVEDATRPDYSPRRRFVSEHATGDRGWVQVANFLVCGVLALSFAIGLRRTLRSGPGATWGPLLLGMWGTGLIVSGLFVTDPRLATPPGAPVEPAQTPQGTIHGLAGIVVFSALPAACGLLARRFAREPHGRTWAAYSAVTGVLIATFFTASARVAALDERGDLMDAPAGSLQRAAIILGWGWVTLLALRLLREAPLSATSRCGSAARRAGRRRR